MTGVIAFFPGQGAQQVGMLSEISSEFSEIKQTFSEASEALDFDLWEMVSTGPAAALNQTFNTQPALLAASVAVWRVLEANCSPLTVVAGAGHSLGEYSALVAADALDFVDAVRLVRRRGQLMEAAVPDGKGGMAAVLGLSDEQIVDVCRQASECGVVEPANYNAPGQIVIAGEQTAIERAIQLAKECGAKRALPLAVSGPFHSSMMKTAAAEFEADLSGISWRTPKFPVYHNASNAPASAEEIPQQLLRQLFSPVNWTGAVAAIRHHGDQAIEVGPGKVVAGLNKRIDKSLSVAVTGELVSLQSTISFLRDVQ